MLVLSIIVLSGLLLLGALKYIECEIISDLPDDNEFKQWWKNYID